MKRRDFVKALGIASGGTVSAIHLQGKDKKLIPYLIPADEQSLPGLAHTVVTTCTECPAGCGVFAVLREGKVIKLEGNPDHPINQGRLCIRGQAALARKYHPERIETPLRKRGRTFETINWDEAVSLLSNNLEASSPSGRRHIYVRSHSSGLLSDVIDRFCKKMAIIRWPEIEPFNHSAIRRANGILFDRSLVPRYRLDRSDLVLSLGADLIETYISPVEFARQLTAGPDRPYWIQVEPGLTLSGNAADLHQPIRPGAEVFLLAFLIQRVQHKNPPPEEIHGVLPEFSAAETSDLTGIPTGRLRTLVKKIERARTPLIITGGPALGSEHSLQTALLAGLLQWALGVDNGQVDFNAAVPAGKTGTLEDLNTLIDQLENRRVGVLVASALHHPTVRHQLSAALNKARFKVAVADIREPFLEQFDLILPLCHSLEAWGEHTPYRGFVSLIRPTGPTPGEAKNEADILLTLAKESDRWASLIRGKWEDLEEGALNRGFATEVRETITVNLNPHTTAGALQRMPLQPAKQYEMAAVIGRSFRHYDGRSLPLQLLSEIPDPLSSVSYGDWVQISPELGRRFSLKEGDVLKVKTEYGVLQAPVILLRGCSRDVVKIPLPLARHLPLPLIKESGELRTILRVYGLEKLSGGGRAAILSGSRRRRSIGKPGHENGHGEKHNADLYPPHPHETYRWGMAIDLDRCNGCSACVAACYIENNVPMTGMKQHLMGREMAWIRLEPYENRSGTFDLIPMLCQHCDHAPCEPVCPVYATYHNPEGLNAQVYNRCVGTRYCSNNCPYKVRRFNWQDKDRIPPLYRVANPAVSVRPKGVMEKCSFCMQRIRESKEVGKQNGEPVTVQPACAQTCPTSAITFGNLLDKESAVYRLSQSGSAHQILHHLGTQPAIYYLNSGRKR